MSEVRNTRRFGVSEVQRIDPVRPLERRRSGDEREQDAREDQGEAPEHGTQHGAEQSAQHPGTDETYAMDGALPEDDDGEDEATIDEYV